MARKKKKKGEVRKLTYVETIQEIRRKFGKHAIIKASDMPEVKFLRLGVPELDFSLGGGLPIGRIIHVYGRKNSGKTFLAMLAVAKFQKMFPKKRVLWSNLENVFDDKRARAVGMDLSMVDLSPPCSAEATFEIILGTVRTGEYGLYVVDSIAAGTSLVETEADMDEQQMGAAPRVINKFFRKWGADTSPFLYGDCPPTLLLNNQRREKIGTYVPTEVSPGGRGIGFFSSVEINIGRGEDVTIKEEDDSGDPITIGHDVKFVVDKNNVFPRGKKGKFLLCTRPYDIGDYRIKANNVDWPLGLVHYAEYYGVLTKRGSNYYYGDKKLGRSRVEAQSALFNNEDLAGVVYDKTMREVLIKHGREKAAEKTVDSAGKAGSKKTFRKKDSGKRK